MLGLDQSIRGRTFLEALFRQDNALAPEGQVGFGVGQPGLDVLAVNFFVPIVELLQLELGRLHFLLRGFVGIGGLLPRQLKHAFLMGRYSSAAVTSDLARK